LPALQAERSLGQVPGRRISGTEQDLYWDSPEALGRHELLEQLVREANRLGWLGDFDNAWSDWDVKLVGDRWHEILIRTATEELGWPRRFTRARCKVQSTLFARVVVGACLVWSLTALASLQTWALPLALTACLLVLAQSCRSRRRCLQAAAHLVERSGDLAGLRGYQATDDHQDVDFQAPATRPRQPAEVASQFTTADQI
jgi:hypothetical protein